MEARNRFKNPFPRPWLDRGPSAAAAAPGNTGLKGIVAGLSEDIGVWEVIQTK